MSARRRWRSLTALGRILVAAACLTVGLGTIWLANATGEPPDAAQVSAAVDRVRAGVLDERVTVFDVVLGGTPAKPSLTGAILGREVWEELVRTVRALPGGRRVSLKVSLLPQAKLANQNLVPAKSLVDVYSVPGGGPKDLVTQALLGEALALLRRSGDWYQVQLGDGYVGWAQAKDLAPRPAGSDLVRVRRISVKARSGPSPLAPVVTDLYLGSVLPRVRRVGEWDELALPGGGTAWVEGAAMSAVPGATQASTLLPGGSVRDALVTTAQMLLGTPYLWGGVTAQGLDCSGLIQTVFRAHGLLLPRDSDQQYSNTQPVTAPQPGDLVFFTTYKDGPSHVGLYLGAGRFIHAGRAGVVIASLDRGAKGYDAALAKGYLGARRHPALP